ncbi:phospholipase [Embleya sp. AB8]|uniref:phospholipase n=1 Tax=Embleya sp. AB8 TaxID=3156304 RepID=UPI003C723FF6
MRRLSTTLAAAAMTVVAGVAVGSPVNAVPADKAQVLSNWTQTSASSYNAWNSARQHQGSWTAYAFDWSTDYCSFSPDNPLGFPFANSCARHDFGYRNYKAAGAFPANKARLDSALYEDLKRVCAPYGAVARATCNGTAWTYYQAVKLLG